MEMDKGPKLDVAIADIFFNQFQLGVFSYGDPGLIDAIHQLSV